MLDRWTRTIPCGEKLINLHEQTIYQAGLGSCKLHLGGIIPIIGAMPARSLKHACCVGPRLHLAKREFRAWRRHTWCREGCPKWDPSSELKIIMTDRRTLTTDVAVNELLPSHYTWMAPCQGVPNLVVALCTWQVHLHGEPGRVSSTHDTYCRRYNTLPNQIRQRPPGPGPGTGPMPYLPCLSFSEKRKAMICAAERHRNRHPWSRRISQRSCHSPFMEVSPNGSLVYPKRKSKRKSRKSMRPSSWHKLCRTIFVLR